jgi:hypothetical protein
MNMRKIAAGLLMHDTLEKAGLDIHTQIELLLDMMAGIMVNNFKNGVDEVGRMETCQAIGKSLHKRVEDLMVLSDAIKDAKINNKDEPEVIQAKIEDALKRAKEAK